MKFNKIIPELSVSNLSKSLKFYTKILSFKVEYRREESKFAFISYKGSQIMLDQLKPHKDNWETGKMKHPFGRGINFEIETDEVDKLISSLKKNHCSLFRPLKESWYRVNKRIVGGKEFLVMDPDGYLLRFSQNIGTKPKKRDLILTP